MPVLRKVDASVARPSAFIRLGHRAYPVFLPTWGDPRLHSAAVILSLQALGQTALGFQLSIAQILVSIFTCALLEVGITFWQHRALSWPASALLTGNSVAFILRVPGTRHGDWWSLNGVELFVLAAAMSLLSKYALRIGHRHIFNPSNLGLVAVFLIFGSRYTNPQDLWWGPMSVGLALALAIIVLGGLLIVRELKMLPMVLAFWIAFAAFVGVIAASGHCITARWHYGPICGQSFWSLLISSPEILVFIFFMMTDPRTAPGGQVARLAYGVSLAFVSALFIAPWQTEFDTKVALFGGLVVICALRPFAERLFPALGSERDRVLTWVRRWSFTQGPAGDAHTLRRLLPAALACATLGICVAGLLAAAGLGARSGEALAAAPVVDQSVALRRPVISLDPSAIPPLTISASASKFDPKLTRATAERMLQDAIEDLVIANDAMKESDAKLAASAATGTWLHEIERGIISARAAGTIGVRTYRFDQATVVLVDDPSAPQDPPAVGLRLKGTIHLATHAAASPQQAIAENDSTYDRTLVLVLVGNHYRISAVSSAGSNRVLAPDNPQLGAVGDAQLHHHNLKSREMLPIAPAA
jgi:hypothetical protein